MNDLHINLSRFTSSGFDRGRPLFVEVLWRLVSGIFFQSPFFPFYAVKRGLLRLFGAKVGCGVLIKPRVTITFPWKLDLGDHVWIGEEAWLDSLDFIRIESHACISQRAYLCTGNHDYRSLSFDLKTAPITIGKGAWVGACAVVGPGVHVAKGAILGLGGVATQNLDSFSVYAGNPAAKTGNRN